MKILKKIFGFDDVEEIRKEDIEILCRKSKNPGTLSTKGVVHAIYEIKLDIKEIRTNQNWIIRFMWVLFGILLYSLK